MKPDKIWCRFSEGRRNIAKVKAAVLNVGITEGEKNLVIAGSIQHGVDKEIRVFPGAIPQILDNLVRIWI